MHRLMFAVALAALAGCASQRAHDPAPIFVASGEGAEESCWRYVMVHESHPDCVLLDEPDSFAPARVTLATNQRVLASRSDWTLNKPWVAVQVTIDGRKLGGWMPRSSLGERPIYFPTDTSVERDGAQSAPRLYRRNWDVDEGLPDRSLATVLAQEAAIARGLGGDPVSPDPALVRANLHRFGRDGGLLDD
ncbi:MAG: hypothetical protein KF696_10795 [Planctomycetes bacterium]|nr:hypothetical protein [Planctomycetota bacterium]MCW8135083.1 hypothetical protein [Planctomycetota bacterium]